MIEEREREGGGGGLGYAMAQPVEAWEAEEPFPLGLLAMATFAISTKASLTPRFILAEHSRYLEALILFATATPSA